MALCSVLPCSGNNLNVLMLHVNQGSLWDHKCSFLLISVSEDYTSESVLRKFCTDNLIKGEITAQWSQMNSAPLCNDLGAVFLRPWEAANKVHGDRQGWVQDCLYIVRPPSS